MKKIARPPDFFKVLIVNHCFYNGKKINNLKNIILNKISVKMSVYCTQIEENSNILVVCFLNFSLFFHISSRKSRFSFLAIIMELLYILYFLYFHPSSIIHHPLSIIHRLSSITQHPSSIIHHPSLIIHHSSSIIHHPLSIIHHPC